jgi:hypothetical protein
MGPPSRLICREKAALLSPADDWLIDTKKSFVDKLYHVSSVAVALTGSKEWFVYLHS